MEQFESKALSLLTFPLSMRNQLVNAVFYDVTLLTAREWLSLEPWVEKKGSVIVVSPYDDKREDSIRHYPKGLIPKRGDGVCMVG